MIEKKITLEKQLVLKALLVAGIVMKIQDIFAEAQNLAQQVNQQFENLVYDFWNFPVGWRGLPALVLHFGTKNNEAMAPIRCLTWGQKSGGNHPGGSPVTRVDFGCGERDGPNHPSQTPVHSFRAELI
jgi:hypothetical protein